MGFALVIAVSDIAGFSWAFRIFDETLLDASEPNAG